MAAADMEAEIFGGGDNAENAGQAVDDCLPAEFATMSADDIARRAISRRFRHGASIRAVVLASACRRSVCSRKNV